MAASKFDIASRALVRIGAKPITSFDDGTAEAIAAGREYEAAASGALTMHRWRFASDQQVLVALEETPHDVWAYALQLPSDLLVLHTVRAGGVMVPYDRYGDKIFCDYKEDVVASYTFRVPEYRWPPYFVDAFTVAFAATMAMAVASNVEMARELREEAEKRLWPRARFLDSEQQTTRRLFRSRLLARRF